MKKEFILKRNFRSFFFATLIGIIGASGGYCMDYYVSPDGLDTNAGTIGAPFRTIAKARDVVRTVNSSMSSDINVYLRGGWYTQSSALTFNSSDSGKNGYNVIYRGYPGERAEISGGQRITGWTSVGGGIYKASLASFPSGSLPFRQLFVNGQRAIRARTPNVNPNSRTPDVGPYYRVVSWDIANKRAKIRIADIPNCSDFTNIEAIFQKQWRSDIYKVTSCELIDSNYAYLYFFSAVRFVEDPSWLFRDNTSFHYENSYNFLDSEGEWFCNSTTQEVFYKPCAGENMSTAEVIAPVLVNLIKVEGAIDSFVHNIQFLNLIFEHATWLWPNANGYIDHQSGEYFGNGVLSDIPGAITVQYANNITFRRNLIRHTGNTGIALQAGTRDNMVIGNVLNDIGSNGISVDNGKYNGSDTRIITKNESILNNYITRVGQDFYDSVGILSGYVQNLKIEHNEIFDCPYSGITEGWGWTNINNVISNNSIRYNRIYNVVNLVCDGGGIYTLGNHSNQYATGGWIEQNYIYNITVSPWINHYAPIAGIYLDNGSSYITVRNNVLENVNQNKYDDNLSEPKIVQWIPWPDSNVTDANIKSAAGIEAAYADIRDGDPLDGTTPPPDTTPPSAPAVVRDGTSAAADSSSTNSSTQLSANWDASTDNESGISGYKYVIGLTPGGSETAGWTTLGNVLTVTKTGLILTVGTTYYFAVKAVNGANPALESGVRNSNGQFVKTLGTNLALNKSVTVSSTETGSNVAANAVDGNMTTRWSSTYSDLQWIYVDLGQVYNVSAVILNWDPAYGLAYKIQVSNDASNWTDVYTTTTGDGGTDDISFTATSGRYVRMNGTVRGSQWGYSLWEFKVYGSAGPTDTTPPSAPGTVRDGATSGTDISSTTSRTQLSANWTQAADSESGISGYSYAIGITAGGTNITNWTTVGSVLTATKTGLTLAVGTTYYFSVKAVNGAGLAGSATNSNGQVVISTGGFADTTAPSAPGTVRDGPTAGTDAGNTYSTTTLSANWATASDAQSGIAGYQYAIGTTAGATNIINWVTIGNVLTVTKTGLTLTVGTTYYFSVKAVNGAGLAGTATNSNGQYVATVNTADTTPPSNISQVRDGADTGADASVTYLTDELSANWDNSADVESGIFRYYYAIGSLPGATDITGWTDNGVITNVTETGLALAVGTTYYFSVKAENGVGLPSAVTNSDGQLVLSMDSQGPLISNVSAQGITNEGATITWETDEPSTSRVEYGLTVIYGSLTGEYMSMNTSHSVSISGLQPQAQYHYRVISRDYSGNVSASVDYTFTTLSTLNTHHSSNAYPNPHSFAGGAPMKFKVNATSAETPYVSIYTISGKLVRKLPAQLGATEIFWDGTNENGEKVIRGIYIYVLTNGTVSKITGKLAVVR